MTTLLRKASSRAYKAASARHSAAPASPATTARPCKSSSPAIADQSSVAGSFIPPSSPTPPWRQSDSCCTTEDRTHLGTKVDRNATPATPSSTATAARANDCQECCAALLACCDVLGI